ncbi:MAG: hypothetical protein AAGC54_18765 [Cyanobacteria bacterium P01_F01_bin.4]
MNLFDPSPQKISPTQLQQLKAWVYEVLTLDAAVPISISQLKCTEPGCPPLETVIAVMTQPPQTYKIHRSAADIEQADIANALTRQGAGE